MSAPCRGGSVRGPARLRTPQPGPSRTLAPLLAVAWPEWRKGKRAAGRRGRPFVCLRSFVFQTFRVRKLRGRTCPVGKRFFSRPSFHILQLTVWDLRRFSPHSRAQSMHAVQPGKMRAHPLPFSAACCRQPSPLRWLWQAPEFRRPIRAARNPVRFCRAPSCRAG